jgi:hypothetical protein
MTGWVKKLHTPSKTITSRVLPVMNCPATKGRHHGGVGRQARDTGGMFGIGNLPTGDKDPFALRRHALGVIRMLVERDLPLDACSQLLQIALAFQFFGTRSAAGSVARWPKNFHLRPSCWLPA